MPRTVKFHLVKDFGDYEVPPPKPAKKIMPDWYKKTPAKLPDELSLKQCVPFLDAMTAGYVIVTHVDMVVRQNLDGSIRLMHPNDEYARRWANDMPLETHPNKQFPNSPMSGYTVLKYMNPWRIETPKGYSTLFAPLFNRLESPIMPMTGIVDTDKFMNLINFPFIHTMLEPGSEVIIPKETPICQLMFFKREDWQQKDTFLAAHEVNRTIKCREEMHNDRLNYYKRKVVEKKRYD